MTQIITTPDGVEHEFPDGASDDVIKKALSSYAKPKYDDASVAGLAGDTAYRAANTGTFGALDYANAAGHWLGGEGYNDSLAKIRQQNDEWQANHPYLAAGADVAGYAVGPGKLKVGAKLAELAGGKLLARVGGSAAEGAGASVLGTAGHGDTDVGDLLKSAALGGSVGAATGALPGGRGPRPTTPPTVDLQNTASGLYKPLESKVYQSSSVAPILDRAGAGVSQGLESKMSSNLADQIARINGIVSKGSQTTASDIADFRSSLMGAARNDVDKTIAGKYLAELDKGVGPKTAADIAAANRASNIAKTSADIEGWAAAPSKAPAAVQSALENSPNFYKTQPGLFDVLSAIGKKGDDPSLLAKLRDYAVRGAVGGGLGYGAGYLMGGNPGQTAVEGAMTGVIGPHVIKAAGNMPIRNSLLAAQHLNATGMKVDPGVYTPQWLQIPGMLARQSGYAAGSSGAF